MEGYEPKEIKKMRGNSINPKSIRKHTKTLKSGFYVSKGNGSWLIANYGCKKCPVRSNCAAAQNEKGEHANGICSPRANMIAQYARIGKGDAIPQLKAFFANIEAERTIEQWRWQSLGLEPSSQWLKMNDQCIKTLETIEKMEQGIKVQVEHNHFMNLREVISGSLRRHKVKIIEGEYE